MYVRVWGMRKEISVEVSAADRVRLATVPTDKVVHVILDNYATHKHVEPGAGGRREVEDEAPVGEKRGQY